jgi:hypothetical protein
MTSTLVNVLESLTMVNYARLKEVRSLTKDPIEYGSIDITNDSENPLIMTFTGADSILDAGEKDTVIVLANFKSNAGNISFRCVLLDIYAYDVNPNIPMDVADKSGILLKDMHGYESAVITVAPSSPKEAFRNYPNPFGRDEDETTIVVHLEQDSEIELRIFTLTGGLVWTMKERRGRGSYYDIKWNGKNDRGKTVLNDVYLCQLQIRPVGGGATQTYITKIAYLK